MFKSCFKVSPLICSYWKQIFATNGPDLDSKTSDNLRKNKWISSAYWLFNFDRRYPLKFFRHFVDNQPICVRCIPDWFKESILITELRCKDMIKYQFVRYVLEHHLTNPALQITMTPFGLRIQTFKINNQSNEPYIFYLGSFLATACVISQDIRMLYKLSWISYFVRNRATQVYLTIPLHEFVEL